METEMKIIDKILNLLNKIKCKMSCCCRSSCSLEPENQENIVEL